MLILKLHEKRTIPAAFRPLLCALVAFGLLSAGNAQALPSDSGHQRNARSHHRQQADANLIIRGSSITLSELFDTRLSRAKRGDACSKSFWGCSRSGRSLSLSAGLVEDSKAARTKEGQQHLRSIRLGRHEIEIVRLPGGKHGRIRFHVIEAFETITIRPEERPTHPIPEPHAALIFMVGIGIAAVRLRR